MVPWNLLTLDSALRASWAADTCSPNDLERAGWQPENPAWGHCDITALIVNDIFGRDSVAWCAMDFASWCMHSPFFAPTMALRALNAPSHAVSLVLSPDGAVAAACECPTAFTKGAVSVGPRRVAAERRTGRKRVNPRLASEGV
ncbi:hypothetical protein [Cryptosporangium sp. NPDC048952]|uniref:YunG family protein n=1 Tax=Cryptosporangium sp. NPDC048952 TaxID=3363961 RepID=UPI003716B998